MTQTTNVTRLFRGPPADTAMDDIPLGRRLRAPPIIAVPTKPALDLSGKPKIMLVIGAGGSGKTMFLRWAADGALQRDPDCTAIFSAIGDRRDLQHYVPNVSQPESFDPAQEARWLDTLLGHCMDQQVSAAIDLDGGDTTVTSLVQQQDDLAGLIEQSGVDLVVAYLLTPRVSDLSTLATLEDAGFQPKATMLILNDGVGDPTVPFEVRFASLMRHAAYRAAVDRGVVVIRMPRLYAAAAVEARQIGFTAARDGVANGKATLGVLDRGRVRAWLNAMDEAFAPVVTWLP